MSITKIICCGDGYAHGHIWPEWPQLLQCIFPDMNMEVVSAVGAGNEYLVSELLCRDIKDSIVIFQWPGTRRFDKLLTDQTWDSIIDSDPVYHFNRCKGANGTWWCSSASQQPEVTQYHKFYISADQAKLREHNYKTLLQAWLEQQSAEWIFISTHQQEHYSKQPRFKHLQGGHTQPHPLIHFWFLVEKILPQLSVKCNDQRLKLIQQRLEAHNWQAYDPDCQQIFDRLLSN